MKNCGDGGDGGSRAGCRGLRPLPGFGAAPQNLCRSTTSQALRAAKGRKKRGSFHPHRFPHPPPPLVSLPSQISAFCALAARSPCICSRLRVALRCAQQPTGLTLPCGALMVSLPSQISAFCALPRTALVFAHTFGSLCATRNSPLGWRFPPVSQNLCRSTTSQALRAAKGRKKRGSFHPHRFPHPGPQGIIPPAAHLFAPLRQGFAPCAPKPAIKPYQQRSQSP